LAVELIDRPIRYASPKRLVGHLDHGGLVVRCLDHPVEFRLLASLLRRLQLRGPSLQKTSEKDRPLNADGIRRSRIGLKPLEYGP